MEVPAKRAKTDTETPVLFWGKENPLSNFWWCSKPFTLQGKEFRTSEQAFMWRKADYMGDTESKTKLEVKDMQPWTAKKLGRQIKSFRQGQPGVDWTADDKKAWDEDAPHIMETVLRAKFDQVPECKAALEATNDRIIAEASPIDGIWGIRLGAKNPDAQDPTKWKGKNQLGKALMETRRKLFQ